jgi:hypothetical protein
MESILKRSFITCVSFFGIVVLCESERGTTVSDFESIMGDVFQPAAHVFLIGVQPAAISLPGLCYFLVSYERTVSLAKSYAISCLSLYYNNDSITHCNYIAVTVVVRKTQA